MNEQELSQRLARVGSHVPQDARLADIGSDHAYLPVALMLKNKITFAVAGEVVKGPFQSAEKQVRKSGLTDQIVVRLADGLDAIEETDRINAITIAGMGGTLIRSILEAGKQHGRINGSERLILQPNVGEKTLREWLVENEYTIIEEEILAENKKIYEIIVAEKQEPVSYSDQELFFGPHLLKEKNDVFIQKWQREIAGKERVLAQLEKAEEKPLEKVAEIQTQLAWIKEVLA
ncbi:tRNA (adenine(22)-N(1))-methyltransferase [Enterococcus saccharolyticus]|uniref:SAM-dependent methyltransferase n=1 Tax=Enterococcus saccharolyticus subsp. saccharolyticus ATCC 43076 TaxID=1139996 RepID=S0NI74_9ENTE|nr:tRNA (adenine(22)-N(1))-methyltransferase TrmK [Enterococcus saccharolyticus]EOT29125.1 SAM-dependent methyltransferase [Enterococcus saccharolyticus subsp. saccharolyticus ATCC 43076]EOT80924.1 SAM-dependent methyltransferase [Enterococcus saccharolyticus subsp. saccharolyticus ATCC 43076]OJG89617.1 SAM-dependent methyltransferase [Enterococcus saccharolyticus]